VSVTFLDSASRASAAAGGVRAPEAWSLVPLERDEWLAAVAVRAGPEVELVDAQHLLDETRL
jgi:hypothetical protein